MQREREAEGDEFKDKEAFVTQAYRDQMAEVRKAEEEEKQREGARHVPPHTQQAYSRCDAELARKKNRGAPTGLSHLYRKLLEESEQQHELTVAAAEAKRPVIGPQGPMPNLTITRPPDHAPPSDLELARQAREQGREVELNDDNQIVDKRDLLAAGLNLSAPNTRRIGLLKSNMASGSTEPVQAHRAVGTAASRKEINDRRAREIGRQVEEERQRAASEQERAEREATERIIARRNTQADVQSAKERYMQRKRQKLEEEAMATDIDTHVHEQEPS
jgi:coiled-coil domain-containing protein 55